MDEKRSGYYWECKYCDCTRVISYPDELDFCVCKMRSRMGRL